MGHSMQQILAQSIREWLDAKPSRSLRMLARLTSVSYSSVRRAAEGNAEQTQEIVLPIASFVMNPGHLAEFIRAYFPKLEKAILDVYYPANESDDIIDFILSEEHSAIIMLSSSRQVRRARKSLHYSVMFPPNTLMISRPQACSRK